ncbi:hypothetical protein AVEN_86078-1 [Araneus ventricosus]|uniref:Mos1 transposase HTH domain-containing protein n=1 Tax=Araneus ventricosus TaxID=182803 RepID=A0A4Y2IMY2_ARAVE|nr:hypothetical protein AVEN_86078-1 [Araneus ventricosus]
MFKTIADPADCEVRAVIRFSNANNVKPAEIHRQLVEIYGENVMTEGMVRKWVRQFNDGRTNVHDEARSGRPSVVNDGLVANVNEKIRENSRFTIRMLCDEFSQISKTVLHEIVTNHLNYRKLYSRWVQMLTDVHKTKGLGSALTFLTRYSEEGNEFLIKFVTGDENLGAKRPPIGVVRKFGDGVPAQVSSSSSDRGPKLRCQSQESPRVASKRGVNITKLNNFDCPDINEEEFVRLGGRDFGCLVQRSWRPEFLVVYRFSWSGMDLNE